MTDAQFAAWLKRNPATYTVLCQIDYVDESNLGSPLPGHLYLATLAYSDATNGRQWRDLIHELPSYSRNLSGDGLRTFASTIGTLVLNNADGRSDYIADLFLDGSDVAFYVGDTSWPIADFRLIYVATATKVTVPSQDRLNIELRDTGILLNRTIGGDVKVGGEGPNADQFRPVNIGYVAQAAAILSDVDTQTFVYNDTGDGLWLGATEQVVRDNGYPVDFTDNGDGSLTLTDQPVGTITTNVMATPAGDEANRLVSDVMDELIGNRAGLTDAGLYDGAQDTFEVMGDEDWPLGLNITERRNIVDVLSDVCDSGLCFWAISRLNHFFYGRLRPGYLAVLAQDFSPVPAGRLITADHVRDGSFAREVADPQWHKLQIYVSRNWAIPGTTVSTDTSGDPRILTPEDLAIVTRRGLAVIQGDSVGVSYETAPELYHKTLSESPALDTLLSDPDDAEATLVADAWMEPARSNQLPWLHTVSVRVPLEFYELELGSQVQLQYPRFGYDYGVQFQVIGIDIALLSRDIGLRLLRRHEQQAYAGRETTAVDDPPDTFREFEGRPRIGVSDGDGSSGGSGGGIFGGVFANYYPEILGRILSGGGGVGGGIRAPVRPDPNGYIVLRPNNGVYHNIQYWFATIEWVTATFSVTGADTLTVYPAEVVTTGVAKNVLLVKSGGNNYEGPAIFIPAHRSEFDFPEDTFSYSNTASVGGSGAGEAMSSETHLGITVALGWVYGSDGAGNQSFSSHSIRFFKINIQGQDAIIYFQWTGSISTDPSYVGVLWASDLPGTLNGDAIPTIFEPSTVSGVFVAPAGTYRYSPRPLNYLDTRLP